MGQSISSLSASTRRGRPAAVPVRHNSSVSRPSESRAGREQIPLQELRGSHSLGTRAASPQNLQKLHTAFLRGGQSDKEKFVRDAVKLYEPVRSRSEIKRATEEVEKLHPRQQLCQLPGLRQQLIKSDYVKSKKLGAALALLQSKRETQGVEGHPAFIKRVEQLLDKIHEAENEIPRSDYEWALNDLASQYIHFDFEVKTRCEDPRYHPPSSALAALAMMPIGMGFGL